MENESGVWIKYRDFMGALNKVLGQIDYSYPVYFHALLDQELQKLKPESIELINIPNAEPIRGVDEQ